MKKILLLAVLALAACQNQTSDSKLNGTYKLLYSETIKGSDTTFVKVDPTKNEMLKIFNNSHFAFFNHNLVGNTDTAFTSGAGTYSLVDGKYTENLDYCNYREWEGNSFHFTLETKGDTLIQYGEEVLPELGINQIIKEVYLKVK